MNTEPAAIVRPSAPKKRSVVKKNLPALAMVAIVAAAVAGLFAISLRDAGVRPLLNSGGDHVYASIVISDTGGSGVLVLPTDGGVFTNLPPSSAVADGGVALGDTDGSGCITGAIATGTFTVNKTCGAGELLLTACVTSLNSGNTAGVARGAWTRTRSGSATQLVPEARKTEIVDAGLTGPLGCVEAMDVSQNGDTYNFTFASNGATAVTHTVKEASMSVVKIRD